MEVNIVYTIQDFFNKKIAIFFQNKNSLYCKYFLQLCEKNKIQWQGGLNVQQDHHEQLFDKNFCTGMKDGFLTSTSSDDSWYKDNGYKILNENEIDLFNKKEGRVYTINDFITEKLCVVFYTQEEFLKFMLSIENMGSIKWRNNLKPTEHPFYELMGVVYNWDGSKTLMYSSTDVFHHETEGYKIVSCYEFDIFSVKNMSLMERFLNMG
jgi:hypothetical protein